MEKIDLNEYLASNEYPGRGIAVAKAPDGRQMFIGYFIMGRSENSRNRVFDPVPERGGICTMAADPAKLEDPSLIIYNPVLTLGKTHIVQSIGHEVRQRHPELQVLYVSMNKFQAQFQTAYKNGEIPDFIHFYQMIDVLIIDDIQELTGKTGTQNAFFNIFNHLQLAGKQLILTSDKPPVELKDIEQRLLTRFKWGLSTQLNTPDYDTKVKIIRIKAQKLGLQLTDEIVRYLADNISANVREIEGALSALVANTVYMGKKVSLSLVKEILKVYVKLYQKEITIDHIIEVVCEYLNLDFARFNSTERTREIGLRMSVGARGVDILSQFLIEAILISITGGIIGVIIGCGASWIVKGVAHWPIFIQPWSVFLSFAVCTVTGVFFGWYPAKKAADLDPIEAIRYE